jgi:hypothetical protein
VDSGRGLYPKVTLFFAPAGNDKLLERTLYAE